MPGKYNPVILALSIAPLYAGPLIGGWMGAPLPMPLALAALFFLAQLAAGKEKGRGEMPLTAFLIMLAGAQLIVVSLVFAIGMGLRQITGPVDAPLWLPLALTGIGAAILSLRYRYDPAEAETMEAIDDAIDQLDNINADLDASNRSPDGDDKP